MGELNHRIDNLTKNIFIVNRQIKQIEEEYDFLITTFQRANDEEIVGILDKLLSGFKKKKKTESPKETIPVNVKDCSSFFNKMNKELKALYEKQIENYKKLKEEHKGATKRDSRETVFLRELDEAVLAYKSMIRVLASQYGILDKMIGNFEEQTEKKN